MESNEPKKVVAGVKEHYSQMCSKKKKKHKQAGCSTLHSHITSMKIVFSSFSTLFEYLFVNYKDPRTDTLTNISTGKKKNKKRKSKRRRIRHKSNEATLSSPEEIIRKEYIYISLSLSLFTCSRTVRSPHLSNCSFRYISS